jgi:hypothetical protein
MTMTKPITPPSLLDNANDHQTRPTGPSLLTSLGNSISPPPVKKRSHGWLWFIVLPLILISLVVAAAFTIADRSSTPATPTTPTTATAPTPAQPSPSPVTAITPPAAPIQAATIINDPLTSDPHQRLSNALTDTQPASTPAVPTAVDTQHITATSPTAPHKTAPLPSSHKPVTTKPATDKSHPADTDDHDVKLLTALVASTPVAKEQPSKAHNTKHATNKPQTSPKDDSRDIVERKPGDSTASLLARCKKLGMIEGELCRWRICADRWDTDPVCKANAHPKASTPDTPAQ